MNSAPRRRPPASSLVTFAAVWLALLVAPAAAPAEDILLVGGRVVTVEGETLERGDVLISDGKVVGVARQIVLPEKKRGEVRTVDVSGLDVYPGWFAMYTQLGLVEIDLVRAVNDTAERTWPSTAQIRAMDAINPESSLIPVQRINGICVALTVPGGPIFTGQSAVIHLGGGSIEECLIKSPAALHLNLGEAGRQGEDKPKVQTRMGLMGVVRAKFIEAREYDQKWARHREDLARHERKLARHAEKKARLTAEGDQEALDDLDEPGLAPKPPDTDLELESIARALRGEVPVMARANRLDDIDAAVRIADEFGLRLIIVGGANAYKMADRLAEKKIPVAVSAWQNPSDMEEQGAIYSNAAKLHAAGVPIALYSEDTAHNVRNLPFDAAMAVAYGLPREEALRAITINPATFLGLDAQLGGIAVGKMANLIVCEGDPFEPTTPIRHVFVAGREVPMHSRQVDLAKPFLGEVEVR